ncbi:MAG TPA: hypothetical protein EYH31_13965, partial [Anaerolineae bacterium]|nr:hypothetical protein [Anaerolineae bacterium]
EDLPGIYHSTNFLVRGNLHAMAEEYLPPDLRELPRVGRRVAIIGGGDTATDCARTARRLQVAQGVPGPHEVTIVYRRSEKEMPGSAEERQYALEEGVTVEYLTAPVRFLADDEGKLRAMECVRMELGEPDASGRRRPVPIEGSNYIMEVDTVVLAIGYWPDPLIGETTPGLETHRWGLIVADPETGATSRPGVFAGGDNVHGPDLVVTAVAAGRRAGRAMHQYLMSKRDERARPGETAQELAAQPVLAMA